MSQFLRPDSDRLNPGGWLPVPANTTLWNVIDEATPNDADYAWIDGGVGTFGVYLSNPGETPGSGDYIMRWRGRRLAGGRTLFLKCQLIEGVNQRADAEYQLTDSWQLFTYTLTSEEVASIENFDNLDMRFLVRSEGGGSPSDPAVSWAEFEVPDAAGNEFVYAGNIPLTAIPATPKGLLGMVYAGNIPFSALPSYTSILDRVYAGAVSVGILPDAPISPLSKSYTGAVALAIAPNSTYGLEFQYVYAGDLAMGIVPSYASILDRIYAGSVPMSLTPSSTRILDRIYSGDILLVALPDFPVASLEKGYLGAIPMSVLPSYSSILDRVYAGAVSLVLVPNSIYELISAGEFVYAGDIPLVALPSYTSILNRVYQGAVTLDILPVFPKALLEKAYAGAVILVLTPDSAYLLESPVAEFIYAGDIPVSLLSGYSSMLEKAYAGDIGCFFMLGAISEGMKMATGIQISKEEPGLLLIGKPDDITFIGKKKPVLISKN